MPLLYFDFPFWYEEGRETDLDVQRRSIRGKTVRFLARPGLLPNPLNWLKDRAAINDGEEEVVREAAVYELARGWRTDPDTLPFLKDRARNDEHEDVRQAAVRELARGWRTDPETLAFLKVKK